MRRQRLSDDQNEKEIEKLQKAIDAAVERRDYATAETLQTKLNPLLEDQKYYVRTRGLHSITEDLKKLEDEQHEEEKKLKQRMQQKMDSILRDADIKLTSMRARHQEEIDKLDRKFSNPHFGALRMSPNIQCLIKAENYYVKNRDFKMARAIKQDITNQAQHEMNIESQYADQTVDAAMAATIKRQKTEMQCFRDALEATKNKLKKETAAGLQGIANRFGNARRRLLLSGNSKEKTLPPAPVCDGSYSGVYKALDTGFAEVQDQVCPPSPRNSPGSPRVTSRSINSNNSTPRSRRTPRQPESPRDGESLSSPRNPRVARALEKSLKRNDFGATI